MSPRKGVAARVIDAYFAEDSIPLDGFVTPIHARALAAQAKSLRTVFVEVDLIIRRTSRMGFYQTTFYFPEGIDNNQRQMVADSIRELGFRVSFRVDRLDIDWTA